MFIEVVGNISSYAPANNFGSMSEDEARLARSQVSMGSISEGEMKLAMDTAIPTNLSPEEMDRFMAQKNAAMNQMPSLDGETYGPSSGVSMDPNVMDMQQMIDAGIINPQRPPMRPSAAPMTSPPPPMRPKNLGGR